MCFAEAQGEFEGPARARGKHPRNRHIALGKPWPLSMPESCGLGAEVSSHASPGDDRPVGQVDQGLADSPPEDEDWSLEELAEFIGED